MTLDSTTSKVQYMQGGTTTEWPVPFKFLDDDDLIVITTTDDVDETLVKDTDYTVTGAGEDAGGTVTISPALASGVRLTIYRSMEMDQPTQLTVAGGWYPAVHERVFDRLTMLIQQVQEEVDRSVKASVSGTSSDDILQDILDAKDEAVDAANNALAAISAAQEAASQIGTLYWLGILDEDEDTIELPWSYDVAAQNVSVFLDGVKQARDTLTFIDDTHIQIGEAVTAVTKYEVLSLLMNSESTLTAILDDAVDAQEAAEAAQAAAEAAQADAEAAMAGALDVPVGTVLFLTGAAIPTGYVHANGQLLSRSTYPDFWTWVQASGNLASSDGAWTAGKYSPGNGSTTFRVPDLRDTFIRGLAASGRAIGSSQAGQVQAHKHVMAWGATDAAGAFGRTTNPAKRGADGSDTNNYWYFTNDGTNYDGTVNASGVIGTETRPANIAYTPIIKAYTSTAYESTQYLEGEPNGELTGTAPVLVAGIWEWAATDDSEFTDGLENGQSCTLVADNTGEHTITLPTASWIGASDWEWSTTGATVFVFFKLGSALYASYIGEVVA